MPRFFIEAIIPDEADQIEIRGTDARHIRAVLRMQPDEALTVCDGARVEFDCRIQSLQGDRVVLKIMDRGLNETEPSFEATLYQGLPKGDKFDLIIQKSVELGISHIVPVACERSIVKISSADVPKKVQRWNRIAQEAAKQCGRGRIPEVSAPLTFAEAIATVRSNGNIAFIPYEGERQKTLRRFLESVLPPVDGNTDTDSANRPALACFIGPEGGFSSAEITLATDAGIRTVSLGRRILRTETAGLAVLAMIGYHVND